MSTIRVTADGDFKTVVKWCAVEPGKPVSLWLVLSGAGTQKPAAHLRYSVRVGGVVLTKGSAPLAQVSDEGASAYLLESPLRQSKGLDAQQVEIVVTLPSGEVVAHTTTVWRGALRVAGVTLVASVLGAFLRCYPIFRYLPADDSKTSVVALLGSAPLAVLVVQQTITVLREVFKAAKGDTARLGRIELKPIPALVVALLIVMVGALLPALSKQVQNATGRELTATGDGGGEMKLPQAAFFTLLPFTDVRERVAEYYGRDSIEPVGNNQVRNPCARAVPTQRKPLGWATDALGPQPWWLMDLPTEWVLQGPGPDDKSLAASVVASVRPPALVVGDRVCLEPPLSASAPPGAAEVRLRGLGASLPTGVDAEAFIDYDVARRRSPVDLVGKGACPHGTRRVVIDRSLAPPLAGAVRLCFQDHGGEDIPEARALEWKPRDFGINPFGLRRLCISLQGATRRAETSAGPSHPAPLKPCMAAVPPGTGDHGEDVTVCIPEGENFAVTALASDAPPGRLMCTKGVARVHVLPAPENLESLVIRSQTRWDPGTTARVLLLCDSGQKAPPGWGALRWRRGAVSTVLIPGALAPRLVDVYDSDGKSLGGITSRVSELPAGRARLVRVVPLRNRATNLQARVNGQWSTVSTWEGRSPGEPPWFLGAESWNLERGECSDGPWRFSATTGQLTGARKGPCYFNASTGAMVSAAALDMSTCTALPAHLVNDAQKIPSCDAEKSKRCDPRR